MSTVVCVSLIRERHIHEARKYVFHGKKWKKMGANDHFDRNDQIKWVIASSGFNLQFPQLLGILRFFHTLVPLYNF